MQNCFIITNITKITWAIRHALSVGENATKERAYTMTVMLMFYGRVTHIILYWKVLY